LIGCSKAYPVTASGCSISANNLIGGVGVSGAAGGEKDEARANAGLAKVADALK
jgi:uncharacterized protein GlcG (DUF336 family)